MEDYNKIIESLNVRYKKAKNVKILQPVTIQNFYDVENTLIIINKGQITFGEEDEVLEENDLLFIPGGKNLRVSYGSGNAVSLSNDDFLSERENFLQNFPSEGIDGASPENFSFITFEAKVFDSVNFFASLDIPPFVIKNNSRVIALLKSILRETISDLPGRNRVISRNTDLLVVEVVRHIIKNRMFVEELATNVTYFKDPRLLDIFAYIKEQLGGDLSNKILANVANVSEDYVGQYFKMLTGINPQDYIEYQRMEKAVQLLRTTKKSIREIGKEVGYKDTAYFCRRFKMMFGIPAGKMRRRESLMNV